MENLDVGNNLFEGIELGIGTWAWGDSLVWGYGHGYNEKDIEESFFECVENGIRLFDTAETYGQGKSESFLGRLIPQAGVELKIATKMMPYPWRIGKNSLRNALMRSLERLKLERVDLYQMHLPLPPVDARTWMDRMAELKSGGLIRGIGVSNYGLERTITAHEELKKRGYRLDSNQLEYHLLERRIELNGLMDYCRQENIKIIAYSPLAMGILTGKYNPDNPPRGVRAGQYDREYLKKIQPLLNTMVRIGNEHEGKTVGQVALNWVMCKTTLPIPGVKNIEQSSQNLGCLGWRLTVEEIEILDGLSERISARLSATVPPRELLKER